MRPDQDFQWLLDASLEAAATQALPDWLMQRREAAGRRFVALGLPTRRHEAWRFNDLRRLRAALGAAPVPPAGPVTGAALTRHRFDDASISLVFVDGCFAPHLSKRPALPAGLWLGTFADALRDNPDVLPAAISATDEAGMQPFASLNAASFADGVVLALAPRVALSSPIELVQYCSTGGGPPVQLRHLIVLGAEAAATIVETACGAADGRSNSVTVTTLADSARLTHVKLQAEHDGAVHLAQTRATLRRGASLDAFFLTLGGNLSRQEIHIALAGEDTHLALNGSYVLRGAQEATIVPVVDHRRPGGQTHELFKGVLQDDAHGIFLGTITVQQGADRTDAHQQNRNLLVSSTARVDTRPELAIYADEVKCSHGATVGDLDEAALFYLQSRGIDPHTARRMLIEAFATEAIDRAALPLPIEAWLRRHLTARLAEPGDAL